MNTKENLSDIVGCGIKRLVYYRDVAEVTLKDDTVHAYGAKYVEKALKGDIDMLRLYRERARALARSKSYIDILNRPVDQMPRCTLTEHVFVGKWVLIDSGMALVGDGNDNDKCLSWDTWTVHHPILDMVANANWVNNHKGKPIDPVAHARKASESRSLVVTRLKRAQAEISAFLASILTIAAARARKVQVLA
jgi:hypothetical protein